MIDWNWLKLAWQYLAMTRNNLSIIWISLEIGYVGQNLNYGKNQNKGIAATLGQQSDPRPSRPQLG